MLHGLETRWLAAIGIYGLEPDQRARALLRLDIDWDTHDAERRSGQFLVTLGRAKHPDGATSLVTATTGWFRDVVLDRRLWTKCRMGLSEEVQQNRKLLTRAHKELSLHRGRPIRWVKGPRQDILEGEYPDLPELSVACTIVY
jgi:hypothetical protein